MTNTERKIFEIINRSRSKAARVPYITKYSGMSSEYTSLICQSLHTRGYINFSRGLARLVSDSAEQATLALASDLPAEPPSEEPTDAPQEARQPEEEIPSAPNNPSDFTGQASQISSLGGITNELVKILASAGYATMNDLAKAPLPKLMSVAGMNVKQAADLINKARGKVGMIG